MRKSRSETKNGDVSGRRKNGLNLRPLPALPTPRKSLADNVGNGEIKAASVIKVFAVVVPEHLLIKVTEQMERFHANVGSRNPALEETPEVFKAVGVYATVYILSRVVNCLVRVLARQTFIREQGIGIECRAGGYVLSYFLLQDFLATAGNDGCTNFTAAFQDAHNGGLVFGPRSSNSALALTQVHIACFATDERFVYFHFAAELGTKEIVRRDECDAA
jgi:hypothetical protein